MGLAQVSCAQKEFQIYVTCAVDLCHLRSRFMLPALLSEDDDISSNYMSFRIIRVRIFDLIFHENDGGCEKTDT